MAFIPEFCSDYPMGLQTMQALDGNDALLSSTLRVGHDEETGQHTDPAIPSGLVRVGTSFQRSVSWAHGCLGFIASERVPVTGPNLLASTYFADATQPRFAFVCTETDTTGEFAYDAYSIACASRTEPVALDNPMVAFWRDTPIGGVKFGFEWPPQLQAPDLNSIRDGLTFSRVRAVELSDGVIAKLTGLAGAGADRIVKVSNDGTLAASLITPALTDGSFAADVDLDDLAERVTVLESDVLPLNGNFEFYSGGVFRNWTGTFDGSGVAPEAGRYIELGTTARTVDSREFAIPGDMTLLEVLHRRPSGTGTSGSVSVRWFDATHSLISSSVTGISVTAANTWETTIAKLSPPASAAFAVVRLANEGSVVLQYGSVRIRPLARLLPATLVGVTLDADFLDYDANSTPRVMLEASGRMSLTGGVKRASSTVVNGEALLTTPAGYRPLTRNRFFCVQCYGGVVNITWQTDGVLVVNTVAGVSASPHLGIWFDGVTFDPRA